LKQALKWLERWHCLVMSSGQSDSCGMIAVFWAKWLRLKSQKRADDLMVFRQIVAFKIGTV